MPYLCGGPSCPGWAVCCPAPASPSEVIPGLLGCESARGATPDQHPEAPPLLPTGLAAAQPVAGSQARRSRSPHHPPSLGPSPLPDPAGVKLSLLARATPPTASKGPPRAVSQGSWASSGRRLVQAGTCLSWRHEVGVRCLATEQRKGPTSRIVSLRDGSGRLFQSFLSSF